MKHYQFLSLGVVLLAGLPGLAGAQNLFSLSNGNTRSGVLDSSTMEWTESKFGVRYQRESADESLFINQIDIVGGVSFNAALNLVTDLNFGGWVGGSYTQNSYTLGTELTGDMDINFDGMVRRDGVVDSSVEVGFYNFTALIKGGSSSSALDTIGSIDFNLEVVPTITASLTGGASPGTIGWGETTHIDGTFTNTGSRAIRTNTWYVSAFAKDADYSDPDNFLELVDFEGNWFNQVLLPGQSRSDGHSAWKSKPVNDPGEYIGRNGVIGGLYEGDSHGWRMTGDRVNVVPEPTSLIALAPGLLLIARRRKKN